MHTGIGNSFEHVLFQICHCLPVAVSVNGRGVALPPHRNVAKPEHSLVSTARSMTQANSPRLLARKRCPPAALQYLKPQIGLNINVLFASTNLSRFRYDVEHATRRGWGTGGLETLRARWTNTMSKLHYTGNPWLSGSEGSLT